MLDIQGTSWRANTCLTLQHSECVKTDLMCFFICAPFLTLPLPILKIQAHYNGPNVLETPKGNPPDDYQARNG